MRYITAQSDAPATRFLRDPLGAGPRISTATTSSSAPTTHRSTTPLTHCGTSFEEQALQYAPNHLVLHSNRDSTSQLPLLDNPTALLPFFRWQRLGLQLNRYDSSFSQLTLLQQFRGAQLQGSLYNAAGPLRGDILFSLPLSIGANSACLKRIAVATVAIMIFFPAKRHAANATNAGHLPTPSRRAVFKDKRSVCR